jgi:CheY-like chemotaxis protein
MIEGKRILVVEDEFLIADVAREMLSDLGAQVVGPVGNVEEALAAIAQGGIDAALVDMNLHGKSGAPIVASLRERHIPFVIASGYGQRLAADYGQILEKPYNADTLATAIAAVLSKG